MLRLKRPTNREARMAQDDLIKYICQFEEEDFKLQLEEEVPHGSHIYMAAFTAFNAQRDAEDKGVVPLSEWLHFGDEPWERPSYFLCTNPECQSITTKYDPLNPIALAAMDQGERIPAGCCTRCGGTVDAI